MATKNKTAETTVSVTDFINSFVDKEEKKQDTIRLIGLMREWSGFEPKMWGPTIIGFGNYHYKYESGHEGDAPLAAFSPRKDSLVLYFSPEFDQREVLLSQLVKHKSTKACVYVKKLGDIDMKVLEVMVVNSMNYAMKLYPSKSQHNP